MKTLPQSRIRIKNIANEATTVNTVAKLPEHGSNQQELLTNVSNSNDSNLKQSNKGPAHRSSFIDLKENVFLLLTSITAFLVVSFAVVAISHYFSFKYAAWSVAVVFITLLGILLFKKQRKDISELRATNKRLISNYARLVRETARNRHELLSLKNNLIEAGQAAQRVQMVGSMSSSSLNEKLTTRILESLVDNLSKIDIDKSSDKYTAIDYTKNNVISQTDSGNVMQYRQYNNLGNVTDTQSLLEDDFSEWSDKKLLKHISEAVRNDKIDLFIQPIVNLPQRKRRFYEMYSRIRIGTDKHIPADRYIEIARKNNMLAEIDNLLLLRGLMLIQTADAANLNRSFFCNITPATLNDSKFMGDLLEFVTQYRILAPRIIFELNQSDIIKADGDMLAVLDGLSKLGCRFSMDKVTSLNFDLDRLDRCHIRFVKISSRILGRKIDEKSGFSKLKHMKDDLNYSGIDLIVDKIENEEQLLKLLDLNIDYGQGYLFGKPKEWTKKQ